MSPKQVKSKKTPQKGKAKTPESKKAAPLASPESSDEDDGSDASSEDEQVAAATKTTPKGKKVANGNKKKQESSDDDDDDSSEEEAAPPVVKPKKQKAKEPEPEESDEDDSDDDESEEEAPPPQQKKPKASAKQKSPKQAKMEVDEDSDEDESDDDESDEEEEAEPVKQKKRKADEVKAAPKKAAKKAKMEEEEEEESDEESEEEEEEEEEEEAPKPKKDRKAAEAKAAAKEKDANTEPSGVSLFIRNIGDLNKKSLMKFFTKNDVDVANINVLGDKGIAFVDLADASHLDAGLALDGTELQGETLSISKAKPKRSPEQVEQDRSEHRQKRDDENKVKMFVRNLSEDVTEEMLKDHFDGAVSVVRPTFPDGNLKGFGFVFFNTEAEVAQAVEDKQGSELGGQALFVDFTGAKSQMQDKPRQSTGGGSASYGEKGRSKVLFVGNLSYSVTEDTLKEVFPDCTAARILTQRDDPSKSRGVGFVDFGSFEDAEAAHSKMQGEEIDGRNIKLDYASERGQGGGGRGGGGGGFGGRGRGRGGFHGGRGGDRGGRGGFRGGRGGFRGGRGGGRGGGGFSEFRGKRKSFADD